MIQFSKPRRVVKHVAAVVLWVALASCMASAQEPHASLGVTESNPASLLAADTRYRIQPLDVVELTLRFTPEFNQTVTVQPDGFVSLLGTGEIRLGGLTVPEATAAVMAEYTSILQEPVVTVVLKEFQRPFFLVLGEVAHPGKFDLRVNARMSDAIATAGGFLPGARKSEILLVRRISETMAEVQKIEWKSGRELDLAADHTLRPGDIIYVSRSKSGKVERFMEVTRLGFYLPLTLPLF